MGEFATDVQEHLCDRLASERPDWDWRTEYRIEGTPVDVAGRGDRELVVVELEWRRADPADNTAKLFRHLDAGEVAADQVTIFQVFTDYYELARGDVSSKRKNAEFVGEVAARATDGLSYHPIEFELEPPKRGGSRPADWEAIADGTVESLLARF